MRPRPERGAGLYGLLLRLYPERLRQERGEEMLELYRALAADAARRGVRGRLGFAARIARDLLVSLPAEHARARSFRRGRSGDGMMGSLWRDTRFAARSFVRAPAFTSAALLTLALGIGATTAMFGVVDRVLLRPLPYAGDGELLQIGLRYGDFRSAATAPTDYTDLLERSRSLAAVAVSRLQYLDLVGDGEPERLDAAGVSHAFFDLLGTAPVLGRGFRPADDTRAAEAVVVLSDGLWRRRFGAAPDIIGRTLRLDDAPYTVIGVMPAAFRPPEAIYQAGVELWFPLGRIADDLDVRGDAFLQMIARTRPGIDAEAAQAELAAIGTQLGEEFPDVGARNFWVADLRDRTVGDARRVLWLLLGAVALLLVIACANVAHLWLVRATERTRELAVRAALGAGRARVARQLLTESVLLALAGGVLGVLLARAGSAAFRAFAPVGLPRMAEIGVDGRVLAFAFAASLATGLLFGLAPLLAVARGDVALRLREVAGTAGTRAGRMRAAFVAEQVALAVVLLAGAALLANGFARLSSVDPGFRAEGVAWIDVAPPSRRYESAARRSALFADVHRRLEAIPGVRSVGAINGLPLHPNRSNGSVLPEGVPPDTEGRATTLHTVRPGYFETLGIPLLAGRDVGPSDARGTELVAVVNATFVRTVFPQGDAVGRRFRFAGNPDAPWITVAGVAADVRHYGLASPVEPMMFLHVDQYPRTWLSFAVRHDGPAGPVLRAMRDAIWDLDPDLTLDDAGTAAGMLRDSLAHERFRTALLGAFAAVALVLTFVGLYGTLAHTARLRRRELGIRVALGAAARDVRALLVRRGLAITAAGLMVGLPAAFAAARLLAGFLYGISAADPITFAAVAAFTAAVALLASWLPAHRAAVLDPARTLRSD